MTSVAENPAASTPSKEVMTLATVVLLSTALLTIANLEYRYALANATSMTNAEHIDATHNTHCDGDICQTVTCINNNCQSLSTQLNQPYTQPQTSSQPSTPTSTSTSTPTAIPTTHTTATHPTVLTINVSPNPVVRGQVVTVSGLLINTLGLPSSGVGGATIKFTGPLGRVVTSPDGSFSTSFTAATVGRPTIQAHYAGAGIYEPSDSVKMILFVT